MINILTLGSEHIARVCTVCHKVYEHKNRAIRTCSNECRKEKIRVSNRVRQRRIKDDPIKLEKYKERVNARCRQKRADMAKAEGRIIREQPMKVLKCKWCQSEYAPQKTTDGKMDATCSDLCRANERVRQLTMIPEDARIMECKESLEPPRKLNCRKYERCLNFASIKNWTGFSCSMCPVEDEWTIEELRQQAKASERFLNSESQLKGVWK